MFKSQRKRGMKECKELTFKRDKKEREKHIID